MNYYFSTAPNTSPMNVRAIRTSATVMIVSWRPLTLTEARGFVSHYTVTYSPQVISGGRKRQTAMTEVVTGMDANMTSIDGLDPDIVYNVHVTATTGGGNGEISIVVSLPQGICLLLLFFLCRQNFGSKHVYTVIQTNFFFGSINFIVKTPASLNFAPPPPSPCIYTLAPLYNMYYIYIYIYKMLSHSSVSGVVQPS